MEITQKLRLLGASSQWDTCGPGTNEQALPGVYHAKTSHGSCRLMKVLYTNQCVHDCKYCCNSTSCKRERAAFEPRELAGAFMSYVRMRAVEGLFLSSSVAGDPDRVTDGMIETARLIRITHRFRGYIHLKVLPGVSHDRVRQLCSLADRVSINLEAPTTSRMGELSSTKEYHTDLLRRMAWLKKLTGKKESAPAGHTTQFVVGAAGESDKEVLTMLNWLYEKMNLRRGYFSAFDPIEGTPLEKGEKVSPVREHRLYQTDWLLRVYGFSFNEITSVLDKHENLPLKEDPKFILARMNRDRFPIEVNEADRGELLRVPGIGPQAVNRILNLRENIKINSLKELKVPQKSLPFLSVNGQKQTTLAGFN